MKIARFAALAALTLLVTTTAASALDRRVRIHNDTSYDIHYFYASNTGSRSWEEDILGDSVLPAGYNVIVNIDDGSGYCKFDFKAVFEDGSEAVSANNNVCELVDFYFYD